MSNGRASQRPSALKTGFAPWLFLGVGTILCLLAVDVAPWLKEYPENWVIPLSDGITAAASWFVDNFKWAFRGISWLLNWPMWGVQSVLQWLPWPLTIAFFAIFAHRYGSFRLALFTSLALGYMAVVGYWSESMNTLALVTLSVPLSISIGLALGIVAFKSERTDRVIQPTLDLMQTIPAFAYLIPILFLFGFGPVVGLISSAIFAIPPMVRNTILGLKQVPPAVLESGIMSGCTPRQRFWQVELPTALPQIMIGVNQSTMAALSMVIIAAIIGGFDDIGWEVLSTMRKAQFGNSLLAGMVIALLAMILDRLSWALANQQNVPNRPRDSLISRYKHSFIALAAFIVITILAQLLPAFATYPDAWVFYPADSLNEFVNYIVRNYWSVMESIKNNTLFFIMLPLRNGLSVAINPFTWGFEVTPVMIWGYAIATTLLTLWLYLRKSWRHATGAAVFALFLFFGTTGTPWPVFIGITTLVAYQAGGRRVALFAFFSMAFMLINGLWHPVMLSVYLCGTAVLLSIILGGLIGIWAAHNDTVSSIIRPINDTLQTMPQFVLLIPVLMLFRVGEFSALLAVIAYAIVPPIRYFEHGLRSVPTEIVEAARQMGCTPRQMLFEVKLPLALPVIMLGLNQAIMYGLGMLVIAAMVGTQGLGQQIFLALGKADMGRGIVTGLSMALVAMVADRILQAYSRKRQEALGL
ncbi:MAG: ABC transporter permease subunit [Gammaproteobacteria bacterium]|nr:ABC transporter permease subunit [Gammaproteobacteria bacterium]